MEKEIEVIEEKQYQEIKNTMNKKNDYFTIEELKYLKKCIIKSDVILT